MYLSAFQDHAITAHVQIYLQIFPYEKAYERQKTAYPPKENVIKIVGFNPYE
ncbi:unnamed protein product [Schistosoma haematobium]|nr:unnamed protein product [Schistosoma haematobium]